MDKPSLTELKTARNQFRTLLGHSTAESEWQAFFAQHPYVLSRSLPIRLHPSDIVPLGRRGRAEPDFIFYPKVFKHIPLYGVIEIKRPDSPIITTTRSNIAVLTRDAETAIQQARQYADQRWSDGMRGQAPGEMLFLGSKRYLFVVMGLSTHLAHAMAIDNFQGMLKSRLPPDLQILPYDTLLARFEAGIPDRMLLLVVHDHPEEESNVNIQEMVASLSEGAKVELLYLYKTVVEGWERSGYKNPYKDLLKTYLIYSTRDDHRKIHVVYNYEPGRYEEVASCLGDDECIVRRECISAIKRLSADQRFLLFDGIELLDANDQDSPK